LKWFLFDQALGRVPFGHSLVNSGLMFLFGMFGTASDTVRSFERCGTRKAGLIYRTGSTDLWAKQFPTFLGQVLHLLSSSLSGG